MTTCFDLNPKLFEYVENVANDIKLWLEDFGSLFDKILTHKLDLTTLLDEDSATPPEVLMVEIGSDCPCSLPTGAVEIRNFDCGYC